ncbi:sugar phosphate isomerase/epimerase [Cytobacillus firmus]|uniref:Sugar phosphate isomerase/epimerase n=2 Tax=Cytobacillus TaxID=2675230 RepID=A0A366JKC2_CYTFI|nr:MULTISPECIES: sugar phosphate isomerase/epimerase [Cytobacillus]RBP86301.1 sugar phosphate isomerase/epimerase [Cytobacillus firmus]TDX35923.1 sugar phosphate isomerase/epimerase [Cytobacillus oceanisediminis]
MKIGTQNQPFFPENIKDKLHYIKEIGFDGFEIDGKLLVDHLEEVKEAIVETGIPVTTACGGYSGWIGDFIEERRQNGLADIKKILEALQEIGGKGIVVPAAWGMFTYRLPPHVSPRSEEGDWQAVSDSLKFLDKAAEETGTLIFLEPLNRYQDHMINTLADARLYIEKNQLKNVKIMADFYHMNIEEDDISEALHKNRELIGHIHLADNHRFQPGSGSLDFKKYFSQLKEEGYEDFLTIECRVRGEHPEEEYKKSLHHLRSSLT